MINLNRQQTFSILRNRPYLNIDIWCINRRHQRQRMIQSLRDLSLVQLKVANIHHHK